MSNRQTKPLRERIRIGEVWTVIHLPSEHIYSILHIAKHTETGEELVVYRMRDNPNAAVWIRPIGMFDDVIEHEAFVGKLPRFSALNETSVRRIEMDGAKGPRFYKLEALRHDADL